MQHYEGLANRAAQNGHVVDIFSSHLDQTGLHEMRYLVNYTGGSMTMCDSFASNLFIQSFQIFLRKDAQGYFKMGFNGQLEVKARYIFTMFLFLSFNYTSVGEVVQFMSFPWPLHFVDFDGICRQSATQLPLCPNFLHQTSRELKVSGCIGSCFSANVKTPSTGESEVGIGHTSIWRLNGLTPSSTLGIFFEVTQAHGQAAAMASGGGRAYVQLVTQYQHASGQRRIRVTTACRQFIDATSQHAYLVAGFDQEAAAVLITRMAMFKAETADGRDALRYIPLRSFSGKYPISLRVFSLTLHMASRVVLELLPRIASCTFFEAIPFIQRTSHTINRLIHGCSKDWIHCLTDWWSSHPLWFDGSTFGPFFGLIAVTMA